MIEVDPDNLHLLGLQMAGRVSLSGVQRKLSLGLDPERKTLRVVAQTSSFILKPSATEFPCLPENEHATLHLARIAGLETPVFGLVRLEGGRPALLVRRFDRTPEGRRLAMEDFCQLDGRAPSEKYQGSAEQCIKILRRFSSQALLDIAAFFRLLLFSWWVGNDDLHMKNVSLLTREPGRPKLSPAYDLVNTAILIPDAEAGMTIGGKRKKLHARDWLQLAEHARLPIEVVAEEASRFIAATKPALEVVRKSLLREDLKRAYAVTLASRINVLEALRDEARARSTRASTAGLEPRPPSAEEAARCVHLLKGTLDAHRIPWSGSAFERDLEELAAWGASEVEPKLDPPKVVKLLRYDRIRKAFSRAEKLDGFDRVAKKLRGLTVSLQGATTDQAWDPLFEIELAAQLVAPFWKIELDREPDLLVRGEDVLGIACKRPRRADTIARNVADAVKQIEKASVPGVVAISLDLVIEPWTIEERTSSGPDAAGSFADVVNVVSNQVRSLLPAPKGDEIELAREGRLEGLIFGVVFTGTSQKITRWSSELDEWNVRWDTAILPNPALQAAEGVLELFAGMLRAGEAELRQTR